MHPNLSENDKRDIMQYLEANQPLPDKYRFLLFDRDKQVELVWHGKTNEVWKTVLPFQTIEQIDEPRVEVETQEQLFDEADFDGSGKAS